MVILHYPNRTVKVRKALSPVETTNQIHRSIQMTEPHYRLSAADLADTGRWRLIIYISARGMTAYLLSVADTEIPAGRIFDTAWEPDKATLLSNIENAVYDNPRVLDDYSADIIIDTDRILWTRRCEDYTEAEDMFCELYHTEPYDIFIHETDGLAALFTLSPGLKGFLDRTFPGTRISSSLSLMADTLSRITPDEPTLYLHCHDSKADYLLISGGKLLCGVSHDVGSAADAAYIIFNMAEVYGIAPAELNVRCDNDSQTMAWLRENVSHLLRSVAPLPLPRVSSDTSMPPAAMFSAARGKSHVPENTHAPENTPITPATQQP